jgi:hypothetical protein
MHTRHLLEFGAVLGALVLMFFLLLAVLRGRHIPQCFQCGAVKVRPSYPSGLVDLVATAILIRPYRCSGCRVRFHAIRLLG